ncbi:NAD-dependent epimerase/dehydratase family protein [Geomicrobium sp. JCM 19055]|uniref:NAD-dependent epimerase/dehydratase family protein n=1 Tax=Geomicrobium sp. JCM 19055 TaxID=1460649 RepID=UPI00045ECC31|nr:NAD-dependent epimerase/dehydratase family protein [Geomicrobium sp. JCM 19055]GAK01468.1 hypothetical protein JCM19055_4632 [Geomicrobium sp. JCM 19055]
MDVLVLGGSRFIGKHIVDRLLHEGHAVTVLNRGNHSYTCSNVEQLIGDRDGDLDVLKGRTWDAAIDVSGYIPRTVDKASACLAQVVAHYTYISSISVYEDFSKVGLTEEDATKQLSEGEITELTKGTAGPIYGPDYGGLKAAGEIVAERNIPGRTLIIRAGLVVGPNDYSDRLPYWLLRIKQGGDVIAPGNPKQQVQFIDVRDLARWIVSSVEQQVTGIYNVTGPSHVMTMEDVLKACNRVCNDNANFVWIDDEFLIDKHVLPWEELPFWLPSSLSGAASVNNEKAINKGLSFSPLNRTIQDTYEWLSTVENMTLSNLKAGMSKERELEVISAWHAK